MTIIKKPSPNFGSRDGNPIKYICLHIMAGTLLGTDNWFDNPKSMVSSNYGVGYNGEIHQYVEDENEAWANGVVKNPSAKIVKDNLNVNQNKISLSIECEGYTLSNAPDTQINALSALISLLATKYNIPIDRDHIIGHYEIDSVDRPNCPSQDKSIIGRIIKVANINQTKPNTMTKWVKFFTTGVADYQTYFTESKTLQNNGETHDFANAQDAVEKSTVEVFIFWDNEPVGSGVQSA